MPATVWRAPEELLPQPAFETHDPSLQRTPAGGDSAAAVTVPGEPARRTHRTRPVHPVGHHDPGARGAGVSRGTMAADGEDRAGY